MSAIIFPDPSYKKLDAPTWFSLSETHQPHAIYYDQLRCYHPDFCPFGGLQPGENQLADVTEYAKLAGGFFIIGEKPLLPVHLTIKHELVCLQMIMQDTIPIDSMATIVQLNQQHADQIFQLVTMVQPGYFKRSTTQLGNYYGIFKDDVLVAVTGERMKMDALTEISAVVTHPAYAGKGYAKALVACAVNAVLREKKTAYLHVTETNSGAIRLYERLGFKTRRKISFWQIAQRTLPH